jgi:hypothetical protein
MRMELKSVFFFFFFFSSSRYTERIRLLQFRIGTAHFESLPEDRPFRRAQFKISREALTLSSTTTALSLKESRPLSFHAPAAAEITSLTGQPIPHAILLGDTNIYHPSELDPVFEAPFKFADAYAVAKKGGGTEEDDRTFGLTFPERWGARKIDYILFRPGEPSESNPSGSASLRPCEARLLGNDPIPDKTCIYGRDRKLFPSDHLGVFASFVWR